MKRKFVFLVAAVAVLAMIAAISCSGVDSMQEDQGKDTIRYGTTGQYPPFSHYRDGKDRGFSPYLTDIIFSRGGYDVEHIIDDWDTIYKGLVNGSIDMAGLVSVTDERKKEVFFSKPLFTTSISIYARHDSEKYRIDNLKDLKVGVMTSYYTREILDNIMGTEQYHGYKDLGAMISDLESGRIDVVFENQQLIDNYLIMEGKKGQIRAVRTNLYPTEMA